MLDFLKRNSQFAIMILVWVACGMVFKLLGVAAVVISILLLKQKNRYLELVLGFFFILIMSDNRNDFAGYARDGKNIYILLLSAFVLFDRKNFRFKNSLFPPFILFFVMGFAALSQTPAANFSTSLQKAISYILLFLIAPVYYHRLFNDMGHKFLTELMHFFSLILIAGIILIPISPNTVFLVGRYSGIFGNPNGVGIFCTLFFMLAYIAKKTFPDLVSKNEIRIIYGVIALSVLLAVSRNSMTSILLFLFFSQFYRMSYISGFMILIVTGIVYQLINNNLVEILQAVGLGEYLRAENLENGSGRIVAWRFGWQVIQSHFFVGRGFSFDEYTFYENRHWLSMLGHQGGVHNSYLALWINTGIIGLIFYLSAFFYTFYKAGLRTYFAMPVMFAVMFSITFEAWLMGSLNPFTIVFILILHLMLHEQIIYEPQKETSAVPVL